MSWDAYHRGLLGYCFSLKQSSIAGQSASSGCLSGSQARTPTQFLLVFPTGYPGGSVPFHQRRGQHTDYRDRPRGFRPSTLRPWVEARRLWAPLPYPPSGANSHMLLQGGWRTKEAVLSTMQRRTSVCYFILLVAFLLFFSLGTSTEPRGVGSEAQPETRRKQRSSHGAPSCHFY